MIPGVLRLPDPVARRFPVDLTGMLHQKSVLFWIILCNPDGVQRYDLRGLPEPRCPECGKAFERGTETRSIHP